MLDLNISTGLKEYNINGKCTVTFNPTDTRFIERVFTVFKTLDEKQEAYDAEVKAEKDNVRLFQIARERDAEMRDLIDNALGAKVCDAVFGDLSVYAVADGLPLWANLMLAIVEEMDDTFTLEKKASNPRLEKYVKKFKKTEK